MFYRIRNFWCNRKAYEQKKADISRSDAIRARFTITLHDGRVYILYDDAPIEVVPNDMTIGELAQKVCEKQEIALTYAGLWNQKK